MIPKVASSEHQSCGSSLRQQIEMAWISWSYDGAFGYHQRGGWVRYTLKGQIITIGDHWLEIIQSTVLYWDTKSKDLFQITSYFPIMLYTPGYSCFFPLYFADLSYFFNLILWRLIFFFWGGGGLNYLNVLLQFSLPEKWLKNMFQVQTFRSLNKSILDTPKIQ